jgi:hypothetical protein
MGANLGAKGSALLDEAGALVDQLRAGRFHDVRRNVSERWALRPCA